MEPSQPSGRGSEADPHANPVDLNENDSQTSSPPSPSHSPAARTPLRDTAAQNSTQAAFRSVRNNGGLASRPPLVTQLRSQGRAFNSPINVLQTSQNQLPRNWPQAMQSLADQHAGLSTTNHLNQIPPIPVNSKSSKHVRLQSNSSLTSKQRT
jgi:hypothetical protein